MARSRTLSDARRREFTVAKALAPAVEKITSMSLIVISREMGSAGTRLGRAVAEHLGYRFADREVVRDVGKRYHIPEEVLAQLEEGKPRFWERLDCERFLVYMQAVAYGFAADDNAVLAGRVVPFLFRGVDHALRVRVTAPVAVRAARLAEEAKIPLSEAEERIARYDIDSAARLAQLFKVECNAAHWYDVVLNTERGSYECYLAVIAEFVRHPPFRSTPESVQALRDRALAAEVRAHLLQISGLDTPRIRVRSESGHVSLEGTVFGPEWEARAIEAASSVPGVRHVVCRSIHPAAGYIPPR
jgi:cytidylate kinase